MQTLIFTGPEAVTALAAASTAAVAAQNGARVLLASVGPSHPIAALAGVAVSAEPQTLAPDLDLWCLDPLADLSNIWGAIRPNGAPPIVNDELPVIPGSDLFLAVARLRKLSEPYDLVCVDAGPPDALLRALGVPDTARWALRLFLGLDRGPGRSTTSVARALIPIGLLPIPLDWTGNIQEARVQLERLRDETVAPQQTRVRYVLRPDAAGLAEARIALPAMQLFGLAVESLIVGPLLPDVPGLTPLVAEQRATIAEAAAIWPGRCLLKLPAMATPGSAQALAEVGDQLYDEASPLPDEAVTPPIRLSGPPTPEAAIDLPGLPREHLGLTLSGDELVIRAGPYRRHLLLPDGLRGITSIKASRQSETLVVRPRT